jgi:serine/threonine protein kinase
LGAYWHGNHFFILQEEAEKSLHGYLKESGDEFESQELWTQMQGVAEGLNTLHKLYKGTKIAYHKDLKPANILIVKRKLKIADFGLLEFKPVSLPGDTDPTGIPNGHNTGFYAAPRQGKYTRYCDIWSLGCIMSEIAVCDIQGREGVSDYKQARMADGASGKDTPRFFCGQQVKDAVLRRHAQLHDHVQFAVATDGNSTTQFQKRFYNKEFFGLLNRMFRRNRTSGNLLEVPGEDTGLDAAHVVETLEILRKEASPTTGLDNIAGNLSLEQYLQDPELLGSSMEAHLVGLRDILNWKNRVRFPATTVTALKQYIVNLQHRQHVERRQQGFSRLGPFLERFGQFGELITTLSGVGEIMGFIWVSASAASRVKAELTQLSGPCDILARGVFDSFGQDMQLMRGTDNRQLH